MCLPLGMAANGKIGQSPATSSRGSSRRTLPTTTGRAWRPTETLSSYTSTVWRRAAITSPHAIRWTSDGSTSRETRLTSPNEPIWRCMRTLSGCHTRTINDIDCWKAKASWWLRAATTPYQSRLRPRRVPAEFYHGLSYEQRTRAGRQPHSMESRSARVARVNRWQRFSVLKNFVKSLSFFNNDNGQRKHFRVLLNEMAPCRVTVRIAVPLPILVCLCN